MSTSDQPNGDRASADRASAEGDPAWIDELGRRAGQAMRKPAPADGLAAVTRQRAIHKRNRTVGGAVAGLALLGGGLFVANRASGDDIKVGVPDGLQSETTVTETSLAPIAVPEATPAETTAPATSTTSAPTTTLPALEPTTQWAIDYVGGTAGIAEGEPVRFGFAYEGINAPPQFQAAVDFLNAEAGGVGGHPIELVESAMIADESATACGQQFASDESIAAVLTGDLTYLGRLLFDGLGTSKATLVQWTGSPEILVDSTIDPADVPGHVLALDGSAHWGTQLRFIANGLPTRPVKIAGLGAFGTGERTLIPNVEFVPVVPGEDKSPAGIVAAIEAAGGADADVITMFDDPRGYCPRFPEIIELLGTSPTVVVPDFCAFSDGSRLLRPESGDEPLVPDGWYVTTTGYNWIEPDLESGWQTYVAAFDRYAVARGDVSVEDALPSDGDGMLGFANVLTIVKLINELGGPAAATSATLREAVRSFKGPMMGQAGVLACGTIAVWGDLRPVPCASSIGVHRFIDGEWIDIGSGTNGTPIGLSGLPTEVSFPAP